MKVDKRCEMGRDAGNPDEDVGAGGGVDGSTAGYLHNPPSQYGLRRDKRRHRALQVGEDRRAPPRTVSVISKCGHEAVSSKKVILRNEPKCDQAGVENSF